MTMLRVAEVAERLGASQKFVRGLLARRELASHRIGRVVRVSERDLQEYLRRARVPARGEREVGR